jgi:formylglycine-generating enzyme required for sulfatase activity
MPSAAGMLKIPAGQYQLGMDVSDQFHAAAQAVSLASFWIDQHLVTNEQYQAYLQDTGSPPPQVWPGDAKHPVRGVTWDQAGAYCDWQNKRLPTEAEWEAAGRGAGAKPPLFPWGNDPTDGGLVLQMPDQDTYEVGSLSFNVSSLGIFDLVGNVWQWVSDPYTGEGPQQHILRGGRFGIPQDLAYRIVVAPGDTRYVMFAGFRCASSSAR